MLNLELYEEIRAFVEELGIDFDELEEVEQDAALGNGGLGRLAACFMEASASMDLPLMGYGVRYSQGIFKQLFLNGFQKEEGDDWLRNGDPWSLRKESESVVIRFGNSTVRAVPYDIPILGYDTRNINTLRLWQAEPMEPFDFTKFNNFEYDASLEAKNRAEDITRVLYPNDGQRSGKVLRFKQQYFFVSASIQDIVRKFKKQNGNFSEFAKYHAIQLNDTHPVIALPELMRVFLDEEHMDWAEAWKIVNETFSFTNHTILAEAMEQWPLDIVEEVCPRCYQLIHTIDKRFVAIHDGYIRFSNRRQRVDLAQALGSHFKDGHLGRLRQVQDGIGQADFVVLIARGLHCLVAVGEKSRGDVFGHGFAVVAGNANDFAVQARHIPRRHRLNGEDTVLHHDDRHRVFGQGFTGFEEARRRTDLQRFFDIVVPVHAFAGDGHKEIVFFDFARIVGDSLKMDIGKLRIRKLAFNNCSKLR